MSAADQAHQAGWSSSGGPEEVDRYRTLRGDAAGIAAGGAAKTLLRHFAALRSQIFVVPVKG